jgi:hypothetical protein
VGRTSITKIVANNYMSKHWIEKAIKHPGAEKRAAAKKGESTHEYMEDNKHKGGKAGARARLGLTLEGMHHGKHKALKERMK